LIVVEGDKSQKREERENADPFIFGDLGSEGT
jgi:hypothetical protein